MLPSPSSSGSKKPKPDAGPNKNPAHSKWKTPGQLRIYNRRLLDALRNPQTASSNAGAIKQAADSALAMTAHGQSHWSRAILSRRHLPHRRRVCIRATKRCRRSAKPQHQPTKDGKVNDRLRALGRLVPGCRKLAAPSLLEEAADYVAALEMQVRAMRALAEALSSAALSPSQEPPAEP